MSGKDHVDVTSQYAIHIERILSQPIERVWSALTNEKQIEIWMEYPTNLEAKIGGRIFVDFSPEDSLDGIVFELKKFEVIAYTWTDSVIRWKLEQQEDRVLLKFSHSAVEEEFLIGLTAGWECFIDNLEAYLNGNKFVDRYEELTRLYREKFKF